MNWKYYNPKFEYEKKFDDSAWPWFGHRNFAYDLVANVKPKRIVELGTHYGTSFWSFCQAAKDEKMDTEFNAIDTWKGEKHSGFYGEEVFKTVKEIKNDFYSKLKINLVRKTFDETASNFKDRPIDILHIDGLHTYEAVRHDFENWLPKVNGNGIILFHDIKVGEDDFGVYKLWEELKMRYETVEFYQSYGLGVLFLNEKIGREFKKNEETWQMHYSYVYEANKSQAIRLMNQEIQIKSADLLTKEQEIQSKALEIKAKNQETRQKNKEITDLKQITREKVQEIQEKEQVIKIKDMEIRLKISETEERSKMIENKNRIILLINRELSDLHQTILQKDKEIETKNQDILNLNLNLKQSIQRDHDLVNIIDKIYRSNSWRITIPLRKIGVKAKRGKAIFVGLCESIEHAVRIILSKFLTPPLRIKIKQFLLSKKVKILKVRNSAREKMMMRERRKKFLIKKSIHNKKIALYLNSQGNYFFREIALNITAGLKENGYETIFRDEIDGFKDDVEWHIVVAPHEFFHIGDGTSLKYKDLPANIIILNTEQPSSKWFQLSKESFGRAYAIWDIDHGSYKNISNGYRYSGFLQLGYSKYLDLLKDVEKMPNNYNTCFLDKEIRDNSYSDKGFKDRPIDICFFGHLSDRRDKFFAENARILAKYNCYFHLYDAKKPLISGMSTKMDSDTVIGIVQRSKILLNIHHGSDIYFEWQRIVMHGIASRTLVISEKCGQAPPFIENRDFIVSDLDEICKSVEYYISTDKGNTEAQNIVNSGHNKFVNECKVGESIKSLIEDLYII